MFNKTTMHHLLFCQQAGGCLDGKQHLQLGDKIGSDGLQKMLSSAGIKGDGAAGSAAKGKTKKRKNRGGNEEEPTEAPRSRFVLLGVDFHCWSTCWSINLPECCL